VVSPAPAGTLRGMQQAEPHELRVDPEGDGFVVSLRGQDRARRWRSATAWPGNQAVPLTPVGDDVAADDDGVVYRVLDARVVGSSLDLLLDRRSDGWLRIDTTATNLDGRGHRIDGAEHTVWMTQRGIADLAPKQRITTFTEHGPESFVITVDNREQMAWEFEGLTSTTVAGTLGCGDYAVHDVTGAVRCAVERKKKSDLQSSVSRGRLLSQMHALSLLPRAAVVMECSYTQALASKRVTGPRLADMLATVQASYPTVPMVYAGNRAAAEAWTFRYLAAAVTLDGQR
jgi:hypothetical protein